MSSTDRGAERARLLTAAAVSDALDRLQVHGQCQGIVSGTGGVRMAGRAFTVRYEPADCRKLTVGDYIDDVPAGGVVVLDNAGRDDASVWGELLTACALRSGVAGTVIDGIFRDAATCCALRYPIFARGRWMRTGKDRVQAVDVNVMVDIGGARISPGDLVIGDADGVVTIPREREIVVLEMAEEISLLETRIRDAVDQGARLVDARRKFGYHGLQRFK